MPWGLGSLPSACSPAPTAPSPRGTAACRLEAPSRAVHRRDQFLYNFFALALALTTVSAPQPAVTPFPNGLRCGQSPEAYGDILPEGNGVHPPSSYIVRIDRITGEKGRLFGYVYVMKDGKKIMEALPESDPTLLRALGLQPLQIKKLTALPKPLRVVPCPASMLHMVRFASPHGRIPEPKATSGL